MRTAPETLTIERLRLAAALTHLVPGAALTVWPDAGPVLTVSADGDAAPDVSACGFRRLVADLSGRDTVPTEHSWMLAVKEFSIDGQGVCHVGDGVVAVDMGGARRWWWVTSLDAASIPGVLQDEAIAMLEHAQVDRDVVADTTISVHVDELLGACVVAADLGSSDVGDPHMLESFVRQMSRGCLVAELLHKERLGCREPRE